MFGKCSEENPTLTYDEACLDITNHLNHYCEVFSQNVECYKCNFESLIDLHENQSVSIVMNTKYTMRMHFVYNGSALCGWKQGFLEHYRYGWNLTTKCTPLFIKKEAANAYLPILIAFVIFFIFGTIWFTTKNIYKCTKNNAIWTCCWKFKRMEKDAAAETSLVIESPPVIKRRNRIRTVDAFRGYCVIMMVFVNYGGGRYWFFEHSIYNGLTIPDFVYPWFLWLMGLSMTISLHSKIQKAVPRWKLIIHIVRRSFILFLMGLIIDTRDMNHTFSVMRFTGILQRLGFTYFIVGMLEAILMCENQHLGANLVTEVTSAWVQWLFMTTLVVVHTCITFFVSLPHCGKGYLGPGGLSDGGKFQNCSGGVSGYIDRAVLGSHLFPGTLKYNEIYKTYLVVDPYGILGTLTAAFLVFLGVHAGHIMINYPSNRQKIIRWAFNGVLFSLLGGFLCGFSKNDGIIPLNVYHTSLSMVFATGGMAFIILSFLFLIIDCTKIWDGSPLFYPGVNPLTIFVLHKIFKDYFPVSWHPIPSNHAYQLTASLWGTVLMICIAIFLYKRNIFISL